MPDRSSYAIGVANKTYEIIPAMLGAIIVIYYTWGSHMKTLPPRTKCSRNQSPGLSKQRWAAGYRLRLNVPSHKGEVNVQVGYMLPHPLDRRPLLAAASCTRASILGSTSTALK